jgi:polyribonucleotide nucleotidyltransferase
MILDTGTRVDGRDLDHGAPHRLRSGRAAPHPRLGPVHPRRDPGSMATCTLGTSGDEQRIETCMEGDTFRHFMLHYNFPPFCVGEAKMLRGPGRREIGHGALARRALEKVLPPKDNFPYTMRIGQRDPWSPTAPPPWPRCAAVPWP